MHNLKHLQSFASTRYRLISKGGLSNESWHCLLSFKNTFVKTWVKRTYVAKACVLLLGSSAGGARVHPY